MQSETGKPSLPLTFTWLQGQPPKERLSEGQGQNSENTQSNGSAGLFPSAGNLSGNTGVSTSFFQKQSMRKNVKVKKFGQQKKCCNSLKN